MILGLGNDLVELRRIQDAIERLAKESMPPDLRTQVK